ncbi:MAG: nitrate- and nitrite sensing domain-containing protein, partial [Stackebrandtia sp.]
MSNRSATEADEAAPPRRRFGLPRLADVRIRSKLVLILVVPVVALMGIAGMRLADSSSDALTVTETSTMVDLTAKTSDLIDALQDERLEVGLQIYKDDLDLDKERLAISAFEDARETTDEALEAFEGAKKQQRGDDTELDAILDRAAEPLNGLQDVHDQVGEEGVVLGELIVYNATITRLQFVLQYA